MKSKLFLLLGSINGIEMLVGLIPRLIVMEVNLFPDGSANYLLDRWLSDKKPQ